MASWFCFKFWFGFRLLLASLTHFNWFAAIYVNCIYFTLWKSYDILWFWMHLLLCSCFHALRPENYLLVFLKLVRAKRGEHANKSYKEIYELLYSERTADETGAERELRRIETVRKERRESKRAGCGQALKPKVDESSTDSDGDLSMITEASGPLYSHLGSSPKGREELPMPTINVDRGGKNRRGRADGGREAEGLVEYGGDNNSDGEGGRKSFWRKMMPNFVARRQTEEAKLARQQAMQRAMNAKKAKKEESEQKLLEKKARRERKKRQMAELRERARVERRGRADERTLTFFRTIIRVQNVKDMQKSDLQKRKNFAGSVDLLINYLRLLTSFAVMVGNIHKTFIPRYLAPPLDNVYDNPDMLMLFTVTLLIDVGFFWLLILWSYCKQMALCCRLGFFRFLLWCAALIAFGGGLMLFPMHLIHQQLEETWCIFEEGQPLSKYFDG